MYFWGVPIADWASVIVIVYTLALFYVLIIREIDRRAEKRLRKKLISQGSVDEGSA